MDPDNSTLIRLGSMLLALTLLISIKTAHSEETPKAAAADSKVLAMVEGRNITQAMLDRYKRQRGASQRTDSTQQTQAMVEKLINREMVKPFSEAVAKLNNGGITKKPVKTKFGWHVIKRDDSRKLPPPLFDTMKEQVRMRLQNKQVENYIGSLRSKAAIARKFLA